ncbi:hypothetical protein LCGC14_0784350 [marine sediment metagenome]|uniref:Replication protein n=1 Tax=marine sediment metagenome TaxID=412755 RepID=A0A0F9SEE7_9ZZZZ
MKKHRAEQRRVADILAGHWDTRAVKPGRRMQRCAESFRAALNLRDAKVKMCPMHCDVMLCAVCLNHRHRTTLKKIKHCIETTVGPQDIIRHSVYTTPRWRGDVREAAETCANWFDNMTRRTAWKDKVLAHMAVFECTGNAVDGWGWHVHVLSIGKYWTNQCKVSDATGGRARLRPARPHHDECECVRRVGHTGRKNSPLERCLMQEWYQTTRGEAWIVHISAAGKDHRDAKLAAAANAINEAVKYVVKTVDLSAAALIDFQIGMRGFKRVRWGGLWYRMNDEPECLCELSGLDTCPVHEPRVMVCPDDLWRFSTGTIGELFARLTVDDPQTDAIARAAGWEVHSFSGPMQKGRARPPPLVKLPKSFAVAAVEGLEEQSEQLERKTELYLAQHPDSAAAFEFGHLPF